MSYDTDTASRYRQHAWQLRRLASADEDRKTREALMQIARDFEQMAQVRDGTESKNVMFLKPALTVDGKRNGRPR
jgi:hypothetical protein